MGVLGSHRASGASPGFSLMELLVVLLLVGIMAGVGGPAVGRFLDSLAFREQTDRVLAAVRYARLQAVAEGRLLVMAVAEGGDSQALALSGAVEETRELDLGPEAELSLEPEQLLFSPEGYATPGRIVLVRGERRVAIDIDALTGLPMLEEDND